MRAATAAFVVFVLCVAADVLYRAHIVATVDGTSFWSTLQNRWHIVLSSWRLSVGPSDWLLYSATAVSAGALVLASPFILRLATARRRT